MSADPIDVAIQAALIAYLKAGSYGGALIAYPYVAYTPAVGTAYLEARPMLRADPENPSLGFAGSNLFRGVFQVDAVAPDGAGEPLGLRLAALVAARFAVGTRITLSTGQYVKLNKIPAIAAAVKDAPWIRFPVSIPYLVIE